jgi:uncharacterized protein YjiS (DUF1127 family)
MDTIGTQPSPTVLLAWSGEALRRCTMALRPLARRVDAWLALRKRAADDLDALAAMSERELRDIGVSRASIHAIAADAWTREVADQSTLI